MHRLITIAVPFSLLTAVITGCGSDAEYTLASPTESALGAETPVVKVTCDFARDGQGAISQFRSLGTLGLGAAPRTTELADESIPGETNTNPVPEDADTFLRAASAVRFIDSADGCTGDVTPRLLVAQDSRRKLGIATFNGTLDSVSKHPMQLLTGGVPAITTIAVDSEASIATLEDDTRDYATFRKKTKKDFEASTTLPDGTLLVVGSGSEMLKVAAGKRSYRSTAIVFDPATESTTRYDLLELYKRLHARAEIVGPEFEGNAPDLNLEGVTVRPDPQQANQYLLSFFHRGNANGNGHNAVVEFDYEEFRGALDASTVSAPDLASVWASVVPRRVLEIRLPAVTSAGDAEGKAVSMTLNDALFGPSKGDATVFLPVGTEAEYTDANGLHHDGVVTFAGMARWSGMDDADGGTCTIYQAPGDDAPGLPTRFGKVEGLASFDRKEGSPYLRSLYSKKALVIGVTDVDSEIAPATKSVLDLSDLD